MRQKLMLLFIFQNLKQKIRYIQRTVLPVFCALLNIELAAFAFLFLQLLADQNFSILKINMFPCKAQRFTLTQAQKQAAHQRRIIGRILRCINKISNFLNREGMYFFDPNRRDFGIFCRVALQGLRFNCLFQRTVQHRHYIFDCFRCQFGFNQLTDHLLHLLCCQVTQPHSAQIWL